MKKYKYTSIIFFIAFVILTFPFSGLDKMGESAFEGMSDMIATFTPIYGIGLTVGVAVLLFTLARSSYVPEVSKIPYPFTEIYPTDAEGRFEPTLYLCNYCGTMSTKDELKDGRCDHCNAPTNTK